MTRDKLPARFGCKDDMLIMVEIMVIFLLLGVDFATALEPFKSVVSMRRS